MFDFIFGGKAKLELIRELLLQRMNMLGFDDAESKLKVKQFGNTQLIGTPEGTVVSIIQAVVRFQKKGLLIGQIIDRLERHRRSIGHDDNEFDCIMKIANSASAEQAGEAVPMYCRYRLDLEYPNLHISDDHLGSAMLKATQNFMRK